MLILTRKQGQTVTVKTLSGTVDIVVKELKGRGEVRLGIEAPRYMDIYRDDASHGEATNVTFASIDKCPRCGLSHLAVEVHELKQCDLNAKKEHFAACPKTGHPVIL